MRISFFRGAAARAMSFSALMWALACGSAESTQVVVGQVAPLSGPEASQGRAYAMGMQLHFNSVNRAGGVNGHTFSLVTKDDGGRPEETVSLTRQLVGEVRPMVLAGYIGGRGLSELVASGILEKERTALVGYRAADVRVDAATLFNVRAGLADELGKIAEHLSTLGMTRVAVFYEDGPAAPALLAEVMTVTGKANVSVVAKASYEAKGARVSDAVDALLQAKPQAIILLCNGAACARFIERYRSDGGAAQLFVHSGADMEQVTKRMAESRLAFVTNAMQGVAIAQVVPNPYQTSRIAKELSDAIARDKPDVPLSYIVLEGFIAAKVITEAVRRQGARPTHAGMAAALESIDSLNLGGYVVGYKAGAHRGSKFVELTIISDTGKIRQ